ncbi:hypothetical protein GCM10028807_52710 [Spirosoma daeguense]
MSLSTLVQAQNLILNPGCDLPLVNGKIPNWVEVVGNEWTNSVSGAQPYSGQGFFFAGNLVDAELAQTIPLDDYTCAIALGNQSFLFTGYVRSYPQSPPDESTVILEILDGNNNVLESKTLGFYNGTTWRLISHHIIVSTQARKIKVRLLAKRRTGTANDGYFDELSLTPVPAGKNFTIQSVNPSGASCGRADGTITVNVAGGGAAKQYKIDGRPTQSSPIFLNLAKGDYNVTVQDGGCILSQTATVGTRNPPTIARIQPTDASCGRADGALSLSVSGGSGAMQYAINGQAFQITPTFLNLAGGRYKVTVKDGECLVSDSATVGNKNLPRINGINVTAASCDQTDGTLIANVSGGSGAPQFSIDGQNFQITPTFINLAVGNYTFTVKDGACLVKQDVAIGRKVIQISLRPTDATCNQANGTLAVTVLGATTNRQISLNNQPFQANSTFQNLTGGAYTITVKDGGCTSSQTATVGNSSPPRIDNVQATQASCANPDGAITISASGGRGNRQFSINGQPFQANATFQGLAVGSYTVTARDEAGCMSTQETVINASGDCYIYVPDAFTPNGDGVNDQFKIISGHKVNYTIRKFAIYSRWGEVIFAKENFSVQDSDVWWDGMYQGQLANAGTYMYYFEYVDQKNVVIPRRGVVTLLR